MRLLLDARMMSPLNSRGIGRYVEELVRAMIPLLTTNDRLVLAVREPEASPFIGLPGVEHIRADAPWYSWEEQSRMPRILREARADLVHVPHWNVPLAYRGPLVITLHDLLLRHQPASAKASTRHPLIASLKRLGYRVALANAIHHARQILVPTEFGKDDLQTLYRVNDEQIAVTGEGLSVFPLPDTRRVTSAPFIFYVGSAYPHKRLDLLLEAWEKLSADWSEYELVIAGEEDAFMARHIAWTKAHNLPRVRFLGRISDAELAALYQAATLFVFPSSFEGFGLPPLEALSFGCPVIASDGSCLPEVLPYAGVIFFRNGERNDMLRALEAARNDLASLRRFAQEASVQVRVKNSWERVAQLTWAAYRKAIL